MNETLTKAVNNGLASVPAVTQYLKSAQSLGLDYRPLLAAANIDPVLLENNNKHISGAAMERLLALLIPASNDPCFGLHSARFVEPASYSVLGYISMNCSTLRMIQAKIPIYEKIVGDMGVTSIEVADGYVLQRWVCAFNDPLVRRHEVENVLGSWVTYARNYLNFDGWDAVWFEHSAPQNPALLGDYSELFGCQVLFDQPANGIRVREAVLDLPLPQANEQILQTLLEHATALLAGLDKNQTVANQVKNILRLMLKQQAPTSQIIAQRLGMSSRTLQRKLGEEGTHYQDVLNELRLELALYFLKNTALSLDSIAYELGYAEARSFYRSFKLWTGRTAGSYRATL
ncbi:AraC family transcriptional regulator [SAR92 clade bacterium H921]|jgi:AraC-like DNA-binding protein|nr:AraC family transcriptional regulator [SAR92 clade bacterium H921]